MSAAGGRADEMLGKQVGRRGFITSLLGAGGALIVGVELVPGLKWLDAAAAAATGGGSLGVYVTIGADESVTLTSPSAEMGQGSSTALAMILAEELMVDWANVRLVLGGYDPALNRPTSATALGASQSTGGSSAVRSYHDYLRNVGATARQKLIWAASAQSSIPVSDLKAPGNGTVVQVSTGNVIGTYGALAASAVGQAPTDVAWVKPPYRFIGQPMSRLDVPAKVNGSAKYGIDVRLDGMLYASVQQAPKVGQTVGSFGSPPAGMTAVAVPGGVAVIGAPTTWQAVQAARNLSVTWVDAPYTASIDSAAMSARANSLLSTGSATAASPVVGDANTVLNAAPAAQRFTGTYQVPYLAHATMEPMNATALVTDTTCEIWAPTQAQTAAANAAAAVTGLPLSAITVHTTYLGGGLGRRLQVDFVKQAVTAAKAVKGTPVKLVWSREEDFTHDYYRPTSLTRLDAATDATGNVTALKARVVCPSSKYQGGTLAAGTVDSSAVDGLVNAIYSFPNKLVEWVLDPSEVPVGSWRSVGNSQNCFFIETFLDEIATATKQDPITLRRNLLSSGSAIHLRALKVLDTLVTQSGWNTAPASGRARGMALSMSFGNTIVGEVAEVSGSFATGFKVQSVTVVIDPGSVINPDTVRAQVESAVHQGLQAAMWQQMPFVAGEPTAKNFNTYRMARLRDNPIVSTTIIESGAPLGGIGEPGLPPVAPAVVNAIAKLTGFRLRALPIAAQPGPAAPTITSFAPTGGTAGTSVVVTGTNLGGATAVKFNATAATAFTVDATGTQVTATVPAGATTGSIAVTTAGGTATSATAFTVSPSAPSISGFSPASGPVGTSVVISGANLTGATAVRFNGTAATSFTVASGGGQITATVPSGATTGPVSVTTAGGTATSSTAFTVSATTTTTTQSTTTTTTATGAPTISSFTPSSGKVGTKVTVNGTNFTGATSVKFNGTAATFTVNSATKLTATVPTGAKTGTISVTTPKGTATTKDSFSVG